MVKISLTWSSDLIEAVTSFLFAIASLVKIQLASICMVFSRNMKLLSIYMQLDCHSGSLAFPEEILILVTSS